MQRARTLRLSRLTYSSIGRNSAGTFQLPGVTRGNGPNDVVGDSTDRSTWTGRDDLIRCGADVIPDLKPQPDMLANLNFYSSANVSDETNFARRGKCGK